MPQQFAELTSAIDEMQRSAMKYGHKPTKMEATRLRKHLMALSKKCKDTRKCILTEVKKIPKVPRKSSKQAVNKQRQTEHAEEVAEEVVNTRKTRKRRAKM